MSYDLNSSEAAAPSSAEKALKVQASKDLERQRKWFQCGQNAKKKGFSNTSPFYENATADYFFSCGFDGVSFEDAQSALTEKIRQVMESNPLIAEVTNAYVTKG